MLKAFWSDTLLPVIGKPAVDQHGAAKAVEAGRADPNATAAHAAPPAMTGAPSSAPPPGITPPAHTPGPLPTEGSPTVEKDEPWERIHDHLSEAINGTAILLGSLVVFCLVALAGRDADLVGEGAELELPVLDVKVAYRLFLYVGPGALIALVSYLQFLFMQRDQIRAGKSKPLPYVFNLPGGVARLATTIVVYWLVPVVIFLFARKAFPRPEEGWVQVLFIVSFALAIVAQAVSAALPDGDWRLRIANMLLLGAGLYFGGTSLANHHTRILDLQEANLKEKNLAEQHLDNADLRKARLGGADLRGAHLSDAKLRGADLQKADLRDAELVRADLDGADLQKANLKSADLSDADLRGANLEGADLRQAVLKGVKVDDSTTMSPHWREVVRLINEGAAKKLNLSWADLTDANLSGSDLKGVILVGADLRRANLTDADLSGADLRLADLRADAAGDQPPQPLRGSPRKEGALGGKQTDTGSWLAIDSLKSSMGKCLVPPSKLPLKVTAKQLQKAGPGKGPRPTFSECPSSGGSAAALWEIRQRSDGESRAFEIRVRARPFLCFDSTGERAKGIRPDLYACNANDNQMWTITRVEDRWDHSLHWLKFDSRTTVQCLDSDPPTNREPHFFDCNAPEQGSQHWTINLL